MPIRSPGSASGRSALPRLPSPGPSAAYPMPGPAPTFEPAPVPSFVRGMPAFTTSDTPSVEAPPVGVDLDEVRKDVMQSAAARAKARRQQEEEEREKERERARKKADELAAKALLNARQNEKDDSKVNISYSDFIVFLELTLELSGNRNDRRSHQIRFT